MVPGPFSENRVVVIEGGEVGSGATGFSCSETVDAVSVRSCTVETIALVG